ncbi:MAG: hypothetical protein L7V87_02855 [Verrucomicrobiales bacterium]|jgi:hypothetical protein|nr:hypothetical protein [Verrucomicrobiales bacterium]
MKSLSRISFAAIALVVLTLSSCETTGDPEPQREKLSSMPHNMPQPWEGQAGFPGQMGQMGGGY